MINFRYHVVSLTAVFLSLAVGLVLGSTVLNGPTLDALESRVNTLGRDNSQLREQYSLLEEEVEREQEFATEAAPLLLDGELTGRRITPLVLPGGEEYADGVVETLTLAGAQVGGQIRLTEKFTHPQHRLTELLDVAHRALPASVSADELPANSDGVESSAALLAAVLFDRDDPDDLPAGSEAEPPPDGEPVGGTVPAADRRTVLSAYAAAEYLEHDEELDAPAELVVVVAGAPAAESDADDRNQAMLVTVEQFAAFGPVVVAASRAAGEDNVVVEIRNHPELADTVSTVDNASTPQGHIATGLTVARHLDGAVGHVGIGDGAQRLLPEAPPQ
ncbi:MAG: copper transporter [Natronosporangium sp.]